MLSSEIISEVRIQFFSVLLGEIFSLFYWELDDIP